MTMLAHRKIEEFVTPHYMLKAYEEVTGNPVYWGTGGDSQFPDFPYLFEEIIMLIVEERTKLAESEIDKELKQLTTRDAFDVEQGFQPSDFGIQGEIEVFNALLESGYAFVHKNQLFNVSVREVW